MLDIVYQYQLLVENLDRYIEESKFKREYLFRELGVSRATFYNKLKKRSFSISEMMKLSELLFPEQAKAFEIKQALERSKKHSGSGKTRLHQDVISDARKRLTE